jgi:protein O-mannosyl-transferase
MTSDNGRRPVSVLAASALLGFCRLKSAAWNMNQRENTPACGNRDPVPPGADAAHDLPAGSPPPDRFLTAADADAGGNAPGAAGNGYQVVAVCGLLLLAVGLVFGQTVHHDFINLDDSATVYLNRHISDGLTPQAVQWAFLHRYAGTWAPLTWVSHMLDCQLYGLNAGGHHATNMLLHATTAVLLFLLLRQMTGRLWPSAFVAAVFAIHPLRVESVAWVTERKDVLSGLFFVLALGAYVRYVRHRFSVLRYLAVVIFFVLGLMAKPMLVTLPLVLLLLDYWPLRRLAAAATSQPMAQACLGQGTQPPPRSTFSIAVRLVLEKVPLLVVTVVFCMVAIWSYGSDGVNVLDQRYCLSWRLGNVPLSFVSYLGMFFYPVNLAVPYPRPGLDLPLGKILGALLVLVALTLATLRYRRQYPYLLVGWLWYLGMLVPVSGFLQFGMQTMADRFTYLPQIGLCLALTWGLTDALPSWPYRRTVYRVAAALVLAVLMGCAWHQTSFWRDNETLWNHTLACTPRNRLAHHALGNTFLHRGQIDQAIEQYQAALAIEPDYAMAHYNLGVALASLGRLDEALEQYQKTVELQPNDAAAHNNLGNALVVRGQLDLGMSHCREALRIDPEFAEAHYNIGHVLYVRGHVEEAIAEYREALKVKPDFAGAHFCLGVAFANRGQLDDAIAEYRKTLETEPDFAAQVHNVLGLALVARGQFDEAVTHYQKAVALKPDFVEAQYNLDKVLARKNRPPKAQ